MAEREVASFMLWVLGGTEVEPYTGFGSSVYIPAFVEFIWKKNRVGASSKLEYLGSNSSANLSE